MGENPLKLKKKESTFIGKGKTKPAKFTVVQLFLVDTLLDAARIVWQCYWDGAVWRYALSYRDGNSKHDLVDLERYRPHSWTYILSEPFFGPI